MDMAERKGSLRRRSLPSAEARNDRAMATGSDQVTLALTFLPEICDYESLYVDVDISTGVGLGNTFADFYNYEKKKPNMKVALGVRPRMFMELFLERMEKLAESLR